MSWPPEWLLGLQKWFCPMESVSISWIQWGASSTLISIHLWCLQCVQVSGCTRHVIPEVLTRVSGEPIALYPKVGSSETLVSTSNITWRMNPEAQQLNHVLRFQKWLLMWFQLRNTELNKPVASRLMLSPFWNVHMKLLVYSPRIGPFGYGVTVICLRCAFYAETHTREPRRDVICKRDMINEGRLRQGETLTQGQVTSIKPLIMIITVTRQTNYNSWSCPCA
jgi:hypothetical protein